MGEILASIGASIGALHIVLFALGIICLVVEMFQPGFGVFGIGGIVLMIIDIIVLAETLTEAMVMFFVLALIVLFMVLLFFVLASCGIVPKSFVLSEKVGNGAASMPDTGARVGDGGVAATRLSPSGRAELNGRTLDVVSRGDFIEEGTPITVVEVSGNRIVVARSGD